MLTEQQIRDFTDEATEIAGDRVTVTERIVKHWTADRESATTDALRRVWDAMVSPAAEGLDADATQVACHQVERVARELGVNL